MPRSRPAGTRRGRLAALVLLLFAALLSPAPSALAATPGMYPHGVGADLGPAPKTLGIRPSAGDDPAGLRTGELDGRTYWRTDVAKGTGHLDLALDADCLRGLGDAGATVSVTYRDTGTGSLVLGLSTPLRLTDSDTWKTGSFDVATADAAVLRLSGTDGTEPSDITVAAVRVGTSGASVTLGEAPQPAGITPRAGDAGSGLLTGAESGRGYWGTDRTAPDPGLNFFYMNVSDTFLYDTRDKVLVSVDYFDAGNGKFGLQYDSPGSATSDMFKPSELFAYGDTKTWKTHTFALDDAVMTNRSNGSDFRITTDGGTAELKVAAVRITVVPAELKPAEGLQLLIAEARRTWTAAREGDRDGQYPAGAKASLLDSIAAAQKAVDASGTTEQQLKAALERLDGALQDFRKSAVDTDLAHGTKATASSGAPAAAEHAAASLRGCHGVLRGVVRVPLITAWKIQSRRCLGVPETSSSPSAAMRG